jgi:gamma-glutamylputrescine oxidase
MTESIYGPSWYAATVMAAPEREPLVYNLDVDACVIGGGLAGLTAGREIARRGWSVAVLEANRVAWSASGRNAGLVAPGFADRMDRIVQRIGFERARALWVLSSGGVDYVRTTIRETQMPGVHPVEGWLKAWRSNTPDQVYAEAELIGERLGSDVEVWSTEQVREVLDTKAYFQALHLPGGFHIHPLNYALGLAAAAEEAGARIFEGTRAVAIDPSGVRKRIQTAGAMVRANHIVLAGSAHLTPLFPMVSASVLPVASYVATTEPLGQRLLETIRYAGAVVDNRRIGDSYRIVDGDRLLWSGRLSSRLEQPGALDRRMRKAIRRVYPQLGDVAISHAWHGVMGYALHMMPLIGEVSPGLWVATGFGGHGLNTSAMAGEMIARAIVEGDDHWRLFASYDLVYAGDRFGRAAAQVLYGFLHAADVIGETLAWRRDAARQRREAAAARAAEQARRRAEEEAARRAEEDAARAAAAERERLATLAAMRRAVDQATHLAVLEARQREDDEAARREAADRLAAARAEADAELFAQAQAERMAAAEAERQAAEEAERFATVRAAEKAERLAREQAAGSAAAEAERLAALQAEQDAARFAREQAERDAAEAAERRASEDAARHAMEQAARDADEQAAHMATAQAAYRIEQETARLAAEAERLARDAGVPAARPDDATPADEVSHAPDAAAKRRRGRRATETVGDDAARPAAKRGKRRRTGEAP